MARQEPNVFRMRLLGARVVPVDSGSRTLKDAINAAMRDWAARIEDTHYLIGSALGPHPYPTIVRDFQSVIGRETRAQYRRAEHGEAIKSHKQSIDLLEIGNQIISARMWAIAIGVILALLTGLGSITVALIVGLTKK
jgi:hypothetical protein